MAIKAPRRKKPVRTSKTLDEKYMGGEPDWGNQEPTMEMMVGAYNWYNYFHNQKDHAKAVRSFYKKDKSKFQLLNKLPDWRFNHVLATICRMRAKGCSVPQQSSDWFDESIQKLFDMGKEVVEAKKEEVKKTIPKVSIQERIREQVGNYIAEIEEQVDLFADKYKSDFNMYDWLRSNDVKAQQSNAIADYYRPLLSELVLTEAGKDPDLNEGYKDVSKKQLKSFIEFVQMLVDDAATWGANQKTVRKTRVKKPQSVSKQVSKLKYQSEYKELKLVSINPADIIGCNQLWVYDTKDRKLKKFDSMGPAGLSIKGTTLQGFDPESSEQKKLRKPEQILPNVLSGGKRILSKLLPDINTKGTIPNGRINTNMIILRAIK